MQPHPVSYPVSYSGFGFAQFCRWDSFGDSLQRNIEVLLFINFEGVKMSEIDRWIEIAKECSYLPENDLKVTYTTVSYQLYLW